MLSLLKNFQNLSNFQSTQNSVVVLVVVVVVVEMKIYLLSLFQNVYFDVHFVIENVKLEEELEVFDFVLLKLRMLSINLVKIMDLLKVKMH